MAIEKLEVILAANAAAFSRGMQDATQAVDRAGKKVAEFGSKVGTVSAVLTGFGGVMVREAAKYDSQVSRAVKDMQGAYSGLAVEFGRALIPAVQQVTHFIDGLTAAWKSLDPETRQAIVNAAALTAGIGGVVAIGAKLVGASASIIAAIVGIGGSFGIIFAAVIAAGAGVATLIGSLEKLKQYEKRKTSSDIAAGRYEDAVAQFKRVNEEIENAETNIAYYKGQGLEDQAEQERRSMLLLKKERDALERVIPGLSGEAVGAASELSKDMPKDFVGYLKSAMGGVGDLFGESAAATFLKKLMAGAPGSRPTPLPTGGPKPLVFDKNKLSDLDLTVEERRLEEEHFASVKSMLESSQDAWETVAEQEKAMVASAADTLTGLSDVVDEYVGRFRQVMKGLGERLTSSLGPAASDVLQGATQGGQAGGPWGAVIGAVAALLSRTQAFARIIQQVEDGLGMLVRVLEPILGPVAKVGAVANELLDVAVTVLEPLMDMAAIMPGLPIDLFLESVRFFVDVLKKFGWGVLYISKLTADVATAIVVWVKDMMYTIGRMLGAEQGNWLGQQFFLAGAFLQNNMVGPLINASAKMQDGMDRLAGSQNNAANAADKMTDVFNGLTESLTNVPAGYKVAAARFNADQDVFANPNQPVIEVYIEGDMAGLVREVDVYNSGQSFRLTGTRFAGRL